MEESAQWGLALLELFLLLYFLLVSINQDEILKMDLGKKQKKEINIDEQENEPLFLKVKPGDTILVGDNEKGKVLTFVGGSRDPNAPTLFQVANEDSGEIHWVHGEEVKEIFSTRTGQNFME